jgi:hypothetical protein
MSFFPCAFFWVLSLDDKIILSTVFSYFLRRGSKCKIIHVLLQFRKHLYGFSETIAQVTVEPHAMLFGKIILFAQEKKNCALFSKPPMRVFKV